ncbi:CDP-alcohol phosphatidyltransferase family protein [Ancylobacter mangrovi]|uniref:Phosphatidylcholine synthase n=1 Tax=Ancylobacter mangrovi TaxID=2972472 RepID=A0A9X2PMP3_9HYPH|nr:CDP-alcohol phosphatidyltransferase family protein [Ancylobacter mangrovi]MCS0496588.1 phosphatidylcholine synthase [Ancylobacter mangrovi]MCS0503759.1 phosphatidylcholine synthase [Ancylobacter mangrovi]
MAVTTKSLGERPTRRHALAFAVHLFTASGAVCGLMALMAAVEGHWALMFAWLGAALFVDGVDGTMARRARVGEVLPRWSGETLDLVVDYLTYVLVPAFAVATGGLMPFWMAVPASAAILLTSALYFADTAMKTDDLYFQGFPAVWNLVVFYFFLLPLNSWVVGGTVALLSVATFLPIKFVHPFRVVRLRLLTIALLALWAVLAAAAVIDGLRPPGWIVAGLCVCAVYFLLFGLIPWRRLRMGHDD